MKDFRFVCFEIMFNNKNILVTGGTGSFGYQFVKNIIRKLDL